MWFWIWCVLLLGTGVLAFLGARDLWRRSKRVVGALGDLTTVLEGVAARADEIAARGPATTARPVDVFAGPEQVAALRESRHVARTARALRRRERHAARYERWRTIDL